MQHTQESEMAYSQLSPAIKRERTTPDYHDEIYNGFHAQMSAEDTRNVDNNDSAEDSGESPLDFSIKRKSRGYDEVSGSDSISSPASSLNDTGGNIEGRGHEMDERMARKSQHESPPHNNALYEQKQKHNAQLLRQALSPVHERIGEPRLAGRGDRDRPEPTSSHSLNHILNGLQMGLISNANMLANTFPAGMAALMDPSSAAAKNTRPFKAYPKDPMSLSHTNIALPQHLLSLANFESSSALHGLNLRPEEIYSIYKQQLLTLKEREKYIETLKLSQNSATRSSTITSSPSPLPSNPLPPSPSLPLAQFSRTNGLTMSHMSGAVPIVSPGTSPHNDNHHNNNNNSLTSSGRLLTSSGRRKPRSLPEELKDESYWDRRRKNNDAAKRSRDTRRAKEDQIAIRAALLEQENLKLRVEVAALKTETAKLRCMLYNS